MRVDCMGTSGMERDGSAPESWTPDIGATMRRGVTMIRCRREKVQYREGARPSTPTILLSRRGSERTGAHQEEPADGPRRDLDHAHPARGRAAAATSSFDSRPVEAESIVERAREARRTAVGAGYHFRGADWIAGWRRDLREWPPWWEWEFELSAHLFKRMEDRRFSEVDLRTMLVRARAYRRDVVEGRWIIETRHAGQAWEVIVEPALEAELLVVVTAYAVWS